ncbi:MAG: NACHT domain-containing NTPase [Xenococcaceae cyanobacterium MO_188.B29]|nr:NACHT domain-containing NTPase [Xenococcaceae cyanobacterium MO_188.B29]
MSKPSLKASPQGIQIAKQALTITGLTQKNLCMAVGCSRQPMTNFFQGKAISQTIFREICDRLNLDWQEIAGLAKPSAKISPVQTSQSDRQTDLDNLTQKLRKQVYSSIREQCGTMRILDMSHPIEVNDIYTNVNILEKISGRRHKRLDRLLRECESEEFDRFGLGKITEKHIPGLEAVEKYQKLIILGKPGAGKTTFLKYLAIQCNEGHFEGEKAPIFVTLKNFAESEDRLSLLEYICYKVAHYSLPTTTSKDIEQYMADFAILLHHGRGLILLDGLDEVREEDQERVIREVRDFSEQFWNNHFVMTCRIAAWEYTFEKFTEVEVADFDENQVAAFANKWFKSKHIRANTFLRHLGQNPRIQQLTVSPLLLTLVCLAFEESGDCPTSRSELYKEGIDALLKKWDATRGIQRDRLYKKLSHQRKEDLLSKLALDTFEQKDYFFKQSFVEQFIADYIRNLSRTNSEPEEIQLDSEAILKSIEAQHGLLIERAKGIYSFSHLTFHEYFTAREIVFNNISLNAELDKLMNHVSDRRWREVFLLTAEMLRDASWLLLPMKNCADKLVASSQKLQNFLVEVGKRAAKLEFSGIKPAALRAFYFDVDFEIDENRTVALQLDRSANHLVCASFLTRMLWGVKLPEAIAISQQYDAKILEPTEKIIAAKSANIVMLIAIKIALSSEKLANNEREILTSLLQKRQEQSADDKITQEIADKARARAKARYHIGGEKYFDDREKKLLREYYYIIQLVVECLHSDGCMLAPELRQRIKDNLFLAWHK